LAIYDYMNDPRTNLTLGKPPKRFTPNKDVIQRQVLGCPQGIQEEGWYFKKRLNETLNFARKDAYDATGERGDVNAQFIVENVQTIRAELLKKFDQETVDTIFDFGCYKRTGELKTSPTKSGYPFKMGLLYTIFATLRDVEGELMLRPSTGRFMSVYQIHRYMMCMSPNHFMGGIARSNVMWHGFRNYLRQITKNMDNIDFKRKVTVNGMKLIVNRGLFTDEEDEFFIAERKKYMAVLRELNRIYRRLLKPEWYDENGYLRTDSYYLLEA